VPLEIFWWRRIVVDEFHELLTTYPPAQIAVRLFRSSTRWGLSGTPPCRTTAEVQEMASFFNCFLGRGRGRNSCPDACYCRLCMARDAASGASDSEDDEDSFGDPEDPWYNGPSQQHLSQLERREKQQAERNCRNWLDRCVRQNTSGLAELSCEEHILLVHQHPAERAIYLQMDQAPFEEESFDVGFDGLGRSAEQRGRDHGNLLKLCSHFQLSGAQLQMSAADECQAVLKRRTREANLAKNGRPWRCDTSREPSRSRR